MTACSRAAPSSTAPSTFPEPLFRRVLGADWDLMPLAVRRMHEVGEGGGLASGRATVERSPGWFAWALSTAMGFPRSGVGVPLSVSFEPSGGGETWTRSFGGRRMRSRQVPPGRRALADGPSVVERFGPVDVLLAVEADASGMTVTPVKAWFLGVPLPAFAVPGGGGREMEDGGVFRVVVDVALLGRPVVRYDASLSR